MNEILKLRHEIHLNQRAFSREIGVSAATISKWETQLRIPRPKGLLALKQLAEQKGVAFDVLNAVLPPPLQQTAE